MSVTRGDGWYVQQPDDEADEIIVGLLDAVTMEYHDETGERTESERSFSPEEAQRLVDALLDKIGEA